MDSCCIGRSGASSGAPTPPFPVYFKLSPLNLMGFPQGLGMTAWMSSQLFRINRSRGQRTARETWLSALDRRSGTPGSPSRLPRPTWQVRKGLGSGRSHGGKEARASPSVFHILSEPGEAEGGLCLPAEQGVPGKGPAPPTHPKTPHRPSGACRGSQPHCAVSLDHRERIEGR